MRLSIQDFIKQNRDVPTLKYQISTKVKFRKVICTEDICSKETQHIVQYNDTDNGYFNTTMMTMYNIEDYDNAFDDCVRQMWNSIEVNTIYFLD